MPKKPVFGTIPNAQREAAAAGLPGIRPVGQADWITVDACYAGQIATKAQLIADRQSDVYRQLSQADDAAEELFAESSHCSASDRILKFLTTA